MRDQQAEHAEQLALQKDIEAAIEHARQLGLSEDELSLLAWASGCKRKDRHESLESN